MRRFGHPADPRHTPSFSRRDTPELQIGSCPQTQGRRECRAMASPMARLQTKKQAAVTTGSAGSTGIPCAMVLTLILVLSPVSVTS